LYMGVFNFFIVIPEIVASLTFKPLVRNVFDNNPLYVVMLGGVALLTAAVTVGTVHDAPDTDRPGNYVIDAAAEEPLTIQGSAQPVPSTGLADDPEARER
ncbi:MAG TPA: hypothetical protein VEQ42_06260, partial [Pyrinomonadaceae bacterium]|nr:hypothetical protein [Pyrinomonadaceae bacterium]